MSAYGDGRWGEALYRGTNTDSPVTHSVSGWAAKLGVTEREVELMLAHVLRARVPLPEPMDGIGIACLELLRTPKGCDMLWRIVSEAFEARERMRAAAADFEARVQRVLEKP